ncbi:hypothetical protein [Rossellomorea aquimaris]|uniref:hypothetical protein n=1 Tax=Rossellomorea aquimaris TaxID=189382 RepID=UPI0011E91579|nr:hypothetical protein [Rossellomorea aquimaris]TYS89815.1 hypothetical protein FZC88_09460 [Rossellomorea aquimaris]
MKDAQKGVGKGDTFFKTMVIISLFISTIEMFFANVISETVENVIWILLVLTLTIYLFVNKNYIYFSIILVIFVIGSVILIV